MSTPVRDTFESPVSWIAPARHAALAELAFGPRVAKGVPMGSSTMSRHLALMSPAALAIDLADAEQCDFGDYELAEQLGQGGMGVVYRARQRSLDREVALKLLAAGPWASADFIERFKREAQSAARMQHPNIVPIYEIGTHAEMTFFTMRLVRGGTLAGELAAKGPMAPKVAARQLRTIAEAVDYAHRLGVLHLDLKPGNVLIDEHGEPQVADFGLARRLDESLSIDSDEVSGTPCYMAPEQAVLRSHKLSPATDIYGLGAVLYECLTGQPPFLGATPQETLHRAVHDPVVAPRARNAAVPADLDAICLKCLEKDPRQRYRSARELAEDLGRYIDERPVSVRPLGRGEKIARWARREPRFAAALGAVALALVVGFVATLVQWRRADANATQASEGLWRTRAQAAQGALADGDGFRGLRPLIANLTAMETAGRLDEAAIERQRIGTVLANAPQLVDLIPIAEGQWARSVAISPDGRYVAISSLRGGRKIRQYEIASGREMWVTATDGQPHVLPFADLPHGEIRYSEDGAYVLAYPQQMPVLAAPTRTDSLAFDARDGRMLVPTGLSEPYADLVFSDDARVALIRFRSDPSLRFPDSAQLYETSGWRALGPRHRREGGRFQEATLLFAPDGRGLLGTADLSRLTLYDPASLDERWTIELPRDEPVRAWRFSPDSKLLALGTLDGSVYLVDTRDASRSELPSGPVATVRWLEFSEDGTTLAAMAENDAIAVWDVASKRPRTAPLLGASEQRLGRVRLAGDSLFRASADALRSWTLAPIAPFDNLALPGAASFRTRGMFTAHSFDVHAESRLLVTGGGGGMLGVWRLPAPTLLPHAAAPLPPRFQPFDGMRYAAVEGNIAVLRDIETHAPASRAFVHPEPVRFAEQSFDGARLVTIAGRTVRVFDPATGAIVGAPMVLPQTPLRADLARKAPVLAVTTGEYDGDVRRERIHRIDLESAVLDAVSPSFPGQAQVFQVDPTGRFALVAAWPPAWEGMSLWRMAITGAESTCEVTSTAKATFEDLVAADDGRSAWLMSQDNDGRRLRRFALDDCRVLVERVIPATATWGELQPLGDGVVASRVSTDVLVVLDAAGNRREVPAPALVGQMRDFAVDAGGRRVALATRNTVSLVDLGGRGRLSAPLAAPIAGNDAIAKLAFSPDGTGLLARTVKGRWLSWRVPIPDQDAASLADFVALLDPSTTDPVRDAGAITALRTRLRADAAHAGDAVANADPSLVLEAAPGTGVDPRYVPVDLAPAINVPLNGEWPVHWHTGGDRPTLAPGAQRFLGIDWRIDGGVQLSFGGPATTIHPTIRDSAVVALPRIEARRVHVLMLLHIPMTPGVPPRTAGRVVLTSPEGRETALEILTVRHVVTHWSPEIAAPEARVGFVAISSVDVRGGQSSSSEPASNVYAVSLDVPADMGPIAGLRLQTGDGPMEAPLFYAVTLEVDPAR